MSPPGVEFEEYFVTSIVHISRISLPCVVTRLVVRECSAKMRDTQPTTGLGPSALKNFI